MSAVIILVGHLFLGGLLLRQTWGDLRLCLVLICLLVIGLTLGELYAMGYLLVGVWRPLELLFAPLGSWLLGPQGR
jgi:hypothetical protein